MRNVWDNLGKAKRTYKLSRIGFTGEVDYPNQFGPRPRDRYHIASLVLYKPSPYRGRDALPCYQEARPGLSSFGSASRSILPTMSSFDQRSTPSRFSLTNHFDKSFIHQRSLDASSSGLFELSECHIDYRPRPAIKRLVVNKVEYTLNFQFKATNNEADYEALLAGICLTYDLGAKQLSALSDSMLIINQVNNTYQVKGKAMEAYLVKA
ncbi:PREDICTED: Mb2253c family [Prunus dulcis]|uniref:PREDICTED: Mb2253c family n=1 Tax=Prunus dulcis TaxID=3755 RepID=A0A5E4FH65_PRUDU|nr:PREDICTED: Mb2253c family [Prunus dulcis]